MSLGVEHGALAMRAEASPAGQSTWLAARMVSLRRRIRAAAQFAYMLLTGPF